MLPELIMLLQAGLAMGALYSLMALGFHLLFITTNILNFATGYLAVFGGLLIYTFLTALGFHLAITLTLTVITGILIGLFFGKVIYYPFRNKGLWLQIMSVFAAGMILENIYMLIWGKEPLRVLAFTGAPIFLAGAVLLPKYLWVIALSATSMVILNLFLNRTIIGKSMLASANNPLVARILGINTGLVSIFAFIISFCFIVFAGALISPITMAGGERAFFYTIKGFTACVIGSISSTKGSLAGGILLGLAEVSIIRFIGSDYAEILVMSILLFFLLLRPQGLFPPKY